MKYLLIITGLFFFQNTWSQQESQFINISNNPYIVNPAASGLTGVIHFEATSRTQWLGYKGGPKTMMLIGSSQIKTKGKTVLSEFNVKDETLFKSPTVTTGKVKHIVGGKIMNDAIGPFSRTSVHGSYALHLPFNKTLNVGAGIGLGWSNFSIDQERVVLYHQDDQAYSSFLGASSSQNFIDANAGIVFYNERFFSGLSISQALKNDASFEGVETESFYNRHYFLVAKYKVDVNTDFGMEPSIVVKYAEKAPLSMDIGAKILYHDAIWFGLQYRTSNAFTVQAGVNIIKNIYASYGYEFSNGALRVANNGTHEIQLGLYIGNNRKIKKEMKQSNKSSEE